MARSAPADLQQLREAVAEALAAREPMELVAGGSKRGLGRPLQTPRTLDLSRLSGIRSYEPNELVLTAAAATPLERIEQALASSRQMLAFEPPDWRRLLGSGETCPTLGGVLACNFAGPRRLAAGAARDHFLGFCGVNGRGEIFKAGGKVVKNVTGYDLCKLMAGSYGTLAVLEEVTVKVLPRPETACTVLLHGLDPSAGAARLVAALGGPHEVSGAAYLPADARMPQASPSGPGRAALRLEGPAPSVAFRRDAVLRELASGGDAEVLDQEASAAFWRGVGDADPLCGLAEHAVWRVSLAPSRGAELAETVARAAPVRWYLDWGGGLVWLAVAGIEDGGAERIRRAIRGRDGSGTGHAMLVKGPPGLRHTVPVLEPQPAALAALSRRVKDSFDPCHILNPGRMVAEI
ncbi:MAG: FAD-binding protein [Alphaproteobacteria bacterium]|nr:FAD-binding protein [Alphaproteobacteria bacterium]MBV9861960.1 FAD-binding protein [Alphaproteobacteria bacterium]